MIDDREQALLFTLIIHYAIMPANSRLVFCSACIVLVILAGMAAGCLSSQTPPASAATPISIGGGNSIAIKNFAFAPPQMTVKAGTVVTWINQDTAPHTIVSDTGSPVAFSSDTLVNGESFKFTFIQPGTYTYHCSIHPSMTGTVIVQS